jgi:hypothetical protein
MTGNGTDGLGLLLTQTQGRVILAAAILAVMALAGIVALARHFLVQEAEERKASRWKSLLNAYAEREIVRDRIQRNHAKSPAEAVQNRWWL